MARTPGDVAPLEKRGEWALSIALGDEGSSDTMVPAKWHEIPELPGEHLVQSALDQERLWSERRDFGAAIRVALLHQSYVHEHAHEVAPVTAGTLEVLRRLGATSVAACLGVAVYQHFPRGPLGEASDKFGQLVSGLGPWSRDSLSFVTGSAALGHSLEGEEVPRKVATALVHQLAGAYELLDDDRFVKWLSEKYAAPSFSPEAASLSAIDPTTLLQQCLTPETPQFDYSSCGPDHAKSFKAVLSTRNGQRTDGEGTTKKAAAMAASLAYLEANFADKLRHNRAKGTDVSPKVPREMPRLKTQRLHEIALQFKVPTELTALLLQVFIHGSWAYENRTLAKRCGQQDNAQLAFLGSQVASHLFSRSVARDALQTDVSDDWAFRTMPNHAFSAAFDSLGLADLMFLGRGQALTTEMKSNAVQALVAVIYLSAGSFAQLEAMWPSSQADALRAIAPQQNVENDPTTKLQIFASAASLTFEDFYEANGPDHGKLYRCTLKLSSPALRRTISISGSYAAGKTQAKQQAAQCVLDGLLALADLRSGAASSDAHSSRPLLTFLLAHLTSVIPTSASLVARWHSLRLLGSQHAGNPTALMGWAREADDLFTQQRPAGPDPSRLGAFYDTVRSQGEVSGQPLRTRLMGLLDWVDGLEPDETRHLKQQDEWVRLICMANLARARAREASPMPVRSIFNDWTVLHPAVTTLDVEVLGPAATLPAASAAAVSLLLDAYMSAVDQEKPVSAMVTSGEEGVSIELIPSAGEPEPHTKRLRELLSLVPDAALGVAAALDRGTLRIRCVIALPDSGPSSVAPFIQAVILSFSAVRTPVDEALAHLLHDLKNQLSAADVALSMPAVTRTEALENRLTASRHLDAAGDISSRLRSAATALDVNPAGSTELAPFLRHYVAEKLLTAPQNIAMSLRAGQGTPTVAISDSAISAVLDNLIKNAFEALTPQGGHVGIEWVVDSDSERVLIEVFDDGPGVPDHVLRALRSRRTIDSTKVGGNGLGLHSVAAVLARLGGDLEVGRLEGGTTWMIAVPMAGEGGGADE
jgi:signal transduction histidine kinase/dsRNA-specific ribonuclease